MDHHNITITFFIDMDDFAIFVKRETANDENDETGWVNCYGEPRDSRVRVEASYGDIQIKDRMYNNHRYPMVKRVFPSVDTM